MSSEGFDGGFDHFCRSCGSCSFIVFLMVGMKWGLDGIITYLYEFTLFPALGAVCVRGMAGDWAGGRLKVCRFGGFGGFGWEVLCRGRWGCGRCRFGGLRPARRGVRAGVWLRVALAHGDGDVGLAHEGLPFFQVCSFTRLSAAQSHQSGRRGNCWREDLDGVEGVRCAVADDVAVAGGVAGIVGDGEFGHDEGGLGRGAQDGSLW